MTPVKVFLIDDDKVFIFLTEKIIKTTAIQTNIQVFNYAREALLKLQEGVDDSSLLPELILLDISMPEMDGWGFLDELKDIVPNIGKRIPLYLVSSTISPYDMERAKSNELVTDLIIKPITKEKMAEVLTACCKKAALETA